MFRGFITLDCISLHQFSRWCSDTMNYDQLSLIWSGLFWSSTITILFCFTLYMDILFKQVCIRCKYLYDSIDICIYIYMYICTYVLMINWTSIYIYSSLWAYIYMYTYMGQWALACYLAPATRMNHGTRVSMTGSCTDIQIQPPYWSPRL